MNKNLLKILNNYLQEMGYKSNLIPLNNNESGYQLVVDLDDEVDLKLTIFFLGDLLNAASTQEGVDEISKELSKNQVDFLQLFIRYPFDFKPSTVPDLARLILMANWSTPIGGFGLNESQGILYYRHVFECMGDEPGENMILEAVNAMAFYAKLRFESLQLIASGDLSLVEYLDELDRDNRRSEEFPGYDL
ncbi:MAG: hypothetical protein K0B14_11730 [Anaerolineaceae bacterium]|nr:hypothetical protein [Anaerolineaceae bacterium]